MKGHQHTSLSQAPVPHQVALSLSEEGFPLSPQRLLLGSYVRRKHVWPVGSLPYTRTHNRRGRGPDFPLTKTWSLPVTVCACTHACASVNVRV